MLSLKVKITNKRKHVILKSSIRKWSIYII